EQATGVPAAAVSAAAKRLREAGRKAILFGRGIVEHPQAAALLEAIEQLGRACGALDDQRSCVMYLGPQNDSQGALDMGLTPDRLPGYAPIADAQARAAYEQAWGATLDLGAGLSAPEILAAAAEGRIKALWIVGDHWLRSAPDRALAERALAGAELVVVNELFLTETARRAHVVFPANAFAEKEGVVVNCERRLQKSIRALAWRKGCKPDWEIFQSVAQALGAKWAYRGAEDVFREIAKLVPGYRGMSWATLLPLGPQWSLDTPVAAGASGAPSSKSAAAPSTNGDGMALLSGGTLFLQGSLSHHGALLPRLAKEARAFLHPDEAQRLGVLDGEPLEIAGPAGVIRVAAARDATVPRGSVFVPYAYPGVELNRLGAPAGSGLRVKVSKAPATALPAVPAGA
ncbi:MAG TPA: molybdopterin-dependent oxidoreductase, partial [Candidatus Eisenbacteria bacterium]|nr:molybdopterin-dependent oxidoreductase [Candidatus Eisenbacteria bacterium]